jgi:hypothetical protein
MGSLITLTRRRHPLATTPHQLDLVLDDARLQGMTPTERQAALLSLVHLLLEAARVATREAGDDHE